MSKHTQASCLAPYLRKMRSARFFFLFTCTTFTVFMIWAQIVNKPPVPEVLIQEALENVGRDLRFTNVYRKTTYLPKNLKYILLWTRRDFAPFSSLEDGQRSFLKHNCSYVNCYVTANKSLFGRDYKHFHAIAFNGRNMKPYSRPRIRFPHQKYIFFNMESSDNYPVCHARYDNFFNLTATYKLDSDIPFPYILIRNLKGTIVGPKPNMRWNDMAPLDDDSYEMGNKTKAAAWFASHCKTRSKREKFVKQLHIALYPYGYKVHTYGKCGHLKCPRDRNSDCNLLLKRQYFFYLSLENSFAEDYVTEKLLTALNHDVVPIVFGGANYSRFLPPGSYLDARKQSIYQLAAIMDNLTRSPEEYRQYFRWKKHYTYHNPSTVENVCNICRALNDKNLMENTTGYQNFRAWWNPNYTKMC